MNSVSDQIPERSNGKQDKLSALQTDGRRVQVAAPNAKQNAVDDEAGPAGVDTEQAVPGTAHHDVEEVDDEAAERGRGKNCNPGAPTQPPGPAGRDPLERGGRG